MKRAFDIVCSVFGLAILSSLLIVLSLLVLLTSKGKVFYKQKRVGKNNINFLIYKFRTMYVDAYKLGLLTVGDRDPRVTRVGYYLRKFKLDELPQLANVLIGDMSIVGPRPEVRRYVNYYTPEQMVVLNVRPGITDSASIEFRNENELLSKQENPDDYYINVIMQKKLQLNIDYLKKRNLIKDIGIILKTLSVVVCK